MNTAKLAGMPNKHRTKIRGIRVPDQLWEDAQAVAEARGESVSDEVRAGLERYVKRNIHIINAPSTGSQPTEGRTSDG